MHMEHRVRKSSPLVTSCRILEVLAIRSQKLCTVWIAN